LYVLNVNGKGKLADCPIWIESLYPINSPPIKLNYKNGSSRQNGSVAIHSTEPQCLPLCRTWPLSLT
jgi:hypothetical protein